MPLLRKPQKNNFKTPYLSQIDKIKDIIDYKLDEPENKKAYNAFVERLSQEKYVHRSSSPKKTYENPEESKDNLQGNESQIHDVVKQNGKIDKNRQETLNRANSLDTSGSLSQEVLNKSPVKAAYIKFMNNYLARDHTDHDKSKKREAVVIITEDTANTAPKKASKKRKRKTESLPVETSQVSESKEKPTKKKITKERKGRTKTKDQLSQIPVDAESEEEFIGLTVEEKMEKLHDLRNVGLYAICDSCNKQRYLPHIVDPLDLPDMWYCFMNPDPKHNKCSDPQHVDEDEEFLIDNSYNAGSIVFAKMNNYPWWPAMVEDDPDTNSYFWLEGDSMTPTYYHVTFFDSAEVTRQWISADRIQAFKKNKERLNYLITKKGKYRSRLEASFKQASNATEMPLIERLKMYGFITRFNKARRGGNNNKKSQNKRRKLLFEKNNISDILEDINLSDLSFNLLD